MKRVWLGESAKLLGRYEEDDLTFVNTSFEVGDSFSYFYPVAMSYSELNSLHFQIGGSFDGPANRVGDWNSRNSSETMEGIVTYNCTAHAETWCIFGDTAKLEILNGSTTLLKDDYVFLLSGTLNGHSKGTRFKVTEDKTVDFTGCLAVKWNTISVAPQKNLAWERLKYNRELALRAGFTWNGMLFDSDPRARSNITDTVLLALTNPSMTIDWTLKDNSVVTLTASDVISVGTALGTFVKAIHDNTRIAREALTP